MTCSICKYWGGDSSEDKAYCKRYPPIMVSIGFTDFPSTYAFEVCGEFKVVEKMVGD